MENEKLDLKIRTRQFAISIVHLVRSIPKNEEGYIIGKQLLRAGTSVGANYRAARRGKSSPDFTNKINIVLEESDECCFWLEIMLETNIGDRSKILPVLKEVDELTAIFTASCKTARQNR